MTVTTNTNKVQALGNGVTTSFPFTFRIYAASDLIVTRTVIATGVDTTLVLNTDYTVTGAASYNGGAVIMASAPATGTRVTIRRVLSITQPTDIRNQGSYFPETHEDALDRSAMINQQQQETLDRAIVFPASDDTSAYGEFPPAATRASNLLGFDENGKPVAIVPSAQSAAALQALLAASSGASLVGLGQGGKVQDAIKWVTPEMFVGATDLIKLQACADYAETNNVWMVVHDHASNYDLGGGTLLLPRKFRGHVRTDSDARGHLFQNGTVTLRTKSHPMVSGVDADTFRCEGLQKGYVHTVRANTFVLDGYNTSWGLFWVNFKDITAGTTTFDLSNFAINANTFENLVSGVTGSYAVNITDNGYAGPNYRECHDNVFITCDFAHSRGVINQSNLNQTNYIIGGYAEDIDAGYKAFSGNFDVSGCNSDTGGVPAVGLLNHVQGMATQIERTGGDFLSMPNESLVVADWSALDSNGKPPAISGSAGCSVVSDGSMPGSSGARYGNTTSTAFDNVKLTLPIIASGTAYPRFSVAGFWYGDLPAAIEVNNGDGSVASYDASSFVSLGSNYYLFRLTGYASSSGTTTVTFFITTSATSRTGYIGACYVSPYKAAPLPYKSALNQNVVSWESGGLLHQKGTASQGYVAASPVTVGITFPKSFTNLSSVTPVVTPIAMTGFGGKMTKFEIKEDSITVNGFSVDVHFSGDWAGTIIWQASGV